MSELRGLIPAAGRGVRAYPYTERIPKAMLEVDGTPVIGRNVELMRSQLGIRDIVVVVGHHGEVIRRYLGDGASFGVKISYVSNDRLDLELPYSVYLAAAEIDGPCCMILGDECYVETNHAALRGASYESALVTCALIASEYKKHIKKNYVVRMQDGLIVDLLEKPVEVTGPLMGTGTYLLHPDVFARLRSAFAGGPESGPRDWTSWLGALARGGERILPFFLEGRYVNINSRDDLNYANFLVRELNFESRRTSLVYVIDENDEEAAAGPVARFAEQPEIDEVIAVARGSSPALDPVAEIKGVSLLRLGPEANIGELLKAGLDRAQGDILLMSHSQDTFSPRDVSKFLVYLRDADMVVGTRTTRQMIEQGTNMRGIVRAAHILLAKLMQVLWWNFESRFTDICCVYRGMWRSTYHAVRGNLTATGVEIYPETAIEVLRARRRIVEIPINYYNRDLEFDYVPGRYQNVATFARISWLMLRRRLADLVDGYRFRKTDAKS